MVGAKVRILVSVNRIGASVVVACLAVVFCGAFGALSGKAEEIIGECGGEGEEFIRFDHRSIIPCPAPVSRRHVFRARRTEAICGRRPPLRNASIDQAACRGVKRSPALAEGVFWKGRSAKSDYHAIGRFVVYHIQYDIFTAVKIVALSPCRFIDLLLCRYVDLLLCRFIALLPCRQKHISIYRQRQIFAHDIKINARYSGQISEFGQSDCGVKNGN